MEGSIEQCCAIRFCFRLGKIGAETHEMIKEAYKDEAMSRAKFSGGTSTSKKGAPPLKMSFALGSLPLKEVMKMSRKITNVSMRMSSG
ncbi:GVQW3-like 3 [Homarus americanus]|uniref:GVQW3-like 3 n=1 Tax=Homarus americanus TaxID=6706 RepID=A0A8J5KCC0_HOMAM|nr:GVQW3-like 3 [Homarus americanus]